MGSSVENAIALDPLSNLVGSSDGENVGPTVGARVGASDGSEVVGLRSAKVAVWPE